MENMAATKHQIHAGLVACRQAMPEVFTRQWPSPPGKWCFAVYTTDDTFIGAVDVEAQARISEGQSGRWGVCKRERAILTGFCQAFNAALATEVPS